MDGSIGSLSIGILLDSDELFWGDCPSQNVTTDQLATAERLVDLSISKLQGQPLSGFRELWERVRPIFPDHGLVSIADGVAAAVQQALLAAVAAARRCAVAELLSAEYDLPRPDPDQLTGGVFLEISDFAATAERIDRMLALRPVGIGYRLTGGRVAEALGPNAEYLQRFVRELGQRADQLGGGSGYRPSIYLGLNGALGQLAVDPIQHIGKVLGNSTGLQMAAGSRRLILEDPFLLQDPDDPTLQPSNLLRLKGFMRRTPSSLERAEPTQLVASGSGLDDETLTVYSDTLAVHAITFDLMPMSDVGGLMARVAKLRGAGVGVFVRLGPQASSPTSPRWINTAVDVAAAAGAAGLVVSYDEGSDFAYRLAIRHLSETAARLKIAREI